MNESTICAIVGSHSSNHVGFQLHSVGGCQNAPDIAGGKLTGPNMCTYLEYRNLGSSSTWIL